MDTLQENKNWLVYMIRCSDGSLYTGITTDMERRFTQHAEGRGAKYFRGRSPVAIAFLEDDHTRSTASKREIELKSLSATKKRALIARQPERQGHGNDDDFARK